MELLNPLMLWGILAISVPIIIHFWHQKKGQVIAWAASNWLIEKNLQQSRGLRLDNWLLLLIRCLLLILLCFLLSKPILHWQNKKNTSTKIHLVEPNVLVLDNFRFEIEQALQKEEKCYWLIPKIEQIRDLNQLPTTEILSAKNFQYSLNQMADIVDNNQVELYLTNRKSLASVPYIFVPSYFSLHVVTDSIKKEAQSFLSFSTNQKLFINDVNQIINTSKTPTNGILKHSGSLKVLLKTTDSVEKQNIKAALNALSEVYLFDFELVEKATKNSNYDLVFDNQFSEKSITENTLYFFSNADFYQTTFASIHKNVIFIPSLLKPQSNEMVFNGNLPAFLGENIINYFGLQPERNELSQQQLKALFQVQKTNKTLTNTWFTKAVFLLFILLLGLERWIAIHKNT